MFNGGCSICQEKNRTVGKSVMYTLGKIAFRFQQTLRGIAARVLCNILQKNGCMATEIMQLIVCAAGMHESENFHFLQTFRLRSSKEPTRIYDQDFCREYLGVSVAVVQAAKFISATTCRGLVSLWFTTKSFRVTQTRHEHNCLLVGILLILE